MRVSKQCILLSMSHHNVIQVRSSLKDGAITRSLVQRRVRFAVSNERSMIGDYQCGQAYVFIYNFEQFTSIANRDSAYHKLSEIRRFLGKQMMVIVVLLETTEPVLNILSWINLACGVELSCSVLLCWTPDEVACYLDSLNSSFATSIEYGYHLEHEKSIIPQLTNAFTQTPQILNRNDVLRIANRKECVADILVSSSSDFENLPGLGTKKLARMHTILNTPFATSKINLNDVLNSIDDINTYKANKINHQTDEDIQEQTRAKLVMNEALNHVLSKEEEEKEENRGEEKDNRNVFFSQKGIDDASLLT